MCMVSSLSGHFQYFTTLLKLSTSSRKTYLPVQRLDKELIHGALGIIHQHPYTCGETYVSHFAPGRLIPNPAIIEETTKSLTLAYKFRIFIASDVAYHCELHASRVLSIPRELRRHHICKTNYKRTPPDVALVMLAGRPRPFGYHICIRERRPGV